MAEKTYTKAQVEEILAQTKAQNKKLKETISSYEAREQEVIRKSASLESREAVLAGKEHVVAQIEARELAVCSMEKVFREIKDSLEQASAELAANKAKLYKDAERLAAELHEKRIDDAEAQVQAIRNEATTAANTIRGEANKLAEEIRNEALSEKKRIIDAAKLEAKEILDKAKLDKEELERQVAELRAENARLSGENTRLLLKNDSLVEDKRTLSDEIKVQKREYDAITVTYARTMANFETLKVQLEENGKSVAEFSKEIAAMDEREQNLNTRENDLKKLEGSLALKEKKINNKEQNLQEREGNIDGLVLEKYSETLANKDEEIEVLRQTTQHLRDSLGTAKSINEKFEDLKALFGGKNPVEIWMGYQTVQQELVLALDKVKDIPSYTLQKTAADLQEKEKALDVRENNLTQKEREIQQIHDNLNREKAENYALKCNNENLEKDKKIIKEQLDRLRSTYENPAGEEERIKAINKPLFEEKLSRVKNLI